MPDQSTPALRCTVCGDPADGIDQDAQALCRGCARGLKLAREGRRTDVGLMLRAAIAAARATGLPEREVRWAIQEELDGDTETRIEENAARHSPLAAMTDEERLALLEDLLDFDDEDRRDLLGGDDEE